MTSRGRSSNILRRQNFHHVEEKNYSLPGCKSLLSWTCFHCAYVSSPYCRSIGQEQQPLLSLLPDLRHYNYIHAHVILRAWLWWLLVLDTLACKKNIARMVLLFLIIVTASRPPALQLHAHMCLEQQIMMMMMMTEGDCWCFTIILEIAFA